VISLTPMDHHFHRSVTFTLPECARVRRAGLVGDFEDAPWNPEGFRMRQDSDGRWRVTLMLECGQIYEFRYLINGSLWVNDDECPLWINSSGIAYSVLQLEKRVPAGLVLIKEGPLVDQLLRMNTSQDINDTDSVKTLKMKNAF
jgi:hypothetical protein